jgi:hypothetical protein
MVIPRKHQMDGFAVSAHALGWEAALADEATSGNGFA